MKVLLLEDVRGVGKKNTVTNVPDGFASNNLIPKRLAIPASSNKAKEIINKQSTKDSAKQEKESAKADKLKQIGTLEIKAKTNEKGSLYQSITEQLIADKIENEFKIPVKPTDINIKPSPVKETGEYTIFVKTKEGPVEIQLLVNSL